MKISEHAQYVTLDTVAECVDGIGLGPLYRKLWDLMSNEETPVDGPLYETPGDAIGQGPNVLAKHWREFTEDEQATLTTALDAHYD